MALPACLYVAAVALWPLAQGIALSLWDYNLIRPQRASFVGLENYRALWHDPSLLAAFGNTLRFTVLAVAIELALGFGLALLLWRDNLFNRVALALVLLPVAVTPLAYGLVFKAVLAVEFGPVGYWARELGMVGERGFFGYPDTALATIIAIDVWQWTPLAALILLAGLKTIPQELLDAAEMDGAGRLQRLRHVVLPMLLPTILLALLLRGMDAFRVFDSVFVTTKGGPGDATNVLQFYAVKQGLEFFNVGYAAAIANFTLACIGLLAGLAVVLLRRADRRMAGA
jgi:multiple sugar transport system permease protein